LRELDRKGGQPERKGKIEREPKRRLVLGNGEVDLCGKRENTSSHGKPFTEVTGDSKRKKARRGGGVRSNGNRANNKNVKVKKEARVDDT